MSTAAQIVQERIDRMAGGFRRGPHQVKLVALQGDFKGIHARQAVVSAPKGCKAFFSHDQHGSRHPVVRPFQRAPGNRIQNPDKIAGDFTIDRRPHHKPGRTVPPVARGKLSPLAVPRHTVLAKKTNKTMDSTDWRHDLNMISSTGPGK